MCKRIAISLTASCLMFIAQAQKIVHREILSRPTDRSITLLCSFDQDVEVCARYGNSSGAYTRQTPWILFVKDSLTEILMEPLGQDTRYYYQLCYRKPGQTNEIYRPQGTFHTQRSPGKQFSFVIQADPHLDDFSDTALYRRCLKNELEDSPDFMIDLGDIFMSDKLKVGKENITHDTVTWRVKYMRSFYEEVCHSLPLYLVLGNHEGEAGWQLNNTSQNVAVFDAVDRKKYFKNPAPDNFYSGDDANYTFIGKRESYYSWTWGDALFVVLDPYFFTSIKPDTLNGWRWTLGKDQYDWLRNTLETSDARFKFVFCHQLVGGDPLGRGGIEYADKYEWGGKNLDGTTGWSSNRPGWYKPIKELLAENKVTIFFHGHDHFFAKQDKDCLIYQLVPQPSLPNFNGPNQAAEYGYFQGKILPNSGHLRVTVGPLGVLTEYIKVYLPSQETGARHNKDIAASYYIPENYCYDTLFTNTPVLWNADYGRELIYPNPSCGEIKIEFSLAEEKIIYLDLFDHQGRRLRRLIDGQKITPQKYEVFWDGRDDRSQEQLSGTYYYKLYSADGLISGGKLVWIAP